MTFYCKILIRKILYYFVYTYGLLFLAHVANGSDNGHCGKAIRVRKAKKRVIARLLKPVGEFSIDRAIAMEAISPIRRLQQTIAQPSGVSPRAPRSAQSHENEADIGRPPVPPTKTCGDSAAQSPGSKSSSGDRKSSRTTREAPTEAAEGTPALTGDPDSVPPPRPLASAVHELRDDALV
jgi:hypothetical protein